MRVAISLVSVYIDYSGTTSFTAEYRNYPFFTSYNVVFLVDFTTYNGVNFIFKFPCITSI